MFDERNEVSTMNATEARRARQAQGKRSMYDRLREDPAEGCSHRPCYLEELRLEQHPSTQWSSNIFRRGAGAACQPKAGLNISRFIGRVKHGKI